jgi:hypothetical protein
MALARISTIIVIVFSALAIKAQFNNLYLTDQRGYGMAIEEDEVTGNYIFPYLFGDPGLGETSLGILKIAPDGSVNEIVEVLSEEPNLTIFGSLQFFKTMDQGYAITSTNNGPYVMKLNQDLQIEWMVGDNDQGSFYGLWAGKELFNQDILVAFGNPDSPGNVIDMRRYSPEGELLFEFGVELNNLYDFPTGIEVKDSMVYMALPRFLMGEYRRNYIVGYNAFTGEEKWEVNQIENDIALGYSDPLMCWNNQGELLYVYFQIEGLYLASSLDGSFSGRLKLAKINLETGGFYEDFYITEMLREFTPLNVKATDDNGLVVLAIGHAPTSLPPCDGPFTTVPYGVLLTKYDSNFEIEWTNYYTPPEQYNTIGGNKILRDLEITTDDCIVAAGTCTGVFYEPFEYFEHPWVLKLDACGNEIITDCSLSGLSELSGRNKISIYPNPARDRVFLKAENAIQRAMIFDMNGKMVHDEIFSGAQEQTLFIDHLPQGLYLVTAIDNKGVRSSSKVVVEK